MSAPPDPLGNRLLAGLPPAEFTRLRPFLHAEQLALRQHVHRRREPIRDLWFPVGAVLSLVALVGDEPAVEVATIGREGCAGLPVFLGSAVSPNDCFAQVSGAAWRLPVADLPTVLTGNGALHDVLHRYTQATMVQLAQNVACNRLHSTEERCGRWLLQTRDRVDADAFDLTQEFLAQMLGVRRGTVSLVAGALQEAGLITYTRGRISILDADGLHEVACECYDVLRDEYARLGIAPHA
jgi:CRP-like cAMP-binding protein